APSMDGYSSPGAPMLVGGYKITYDATPPCAIFMDLEVLSRAPLPLIQAGFSDLVGKITANADWTIRNILQGEYFCEYTWELVKGAMEILRENAEEIGKRKEEAIYALAVALLNSGFSMTMVGDSRPASGAEHLVAHYLEIMALHRKMNPSLHGLRVGGATVIVKKMYDRFLQELEEIDWKKSENYSFTSQEEELKIHFGPLFPFIEKDAQEKLKWDREEMKIANPSLLYRQLQDKLSVIPDPASVLRRAQAPQTLEELGFSKKMIREALLFSRFIRKRVTILDLLGKAGLLKEYVDYALS
ncbi:MAG TPA: iron-containing alcohol dehydrogenase, partial [Candidatus Atribacteria bacterium]|nr:iron-containing alcohol dehydrogenase [Candidatus Atribacteria bacterium]